MKPHSLSKIVIFILAGILLAGGAYAGNTRKNKKPQPVQPQPPQQPLEDRSTEVSWTGTLTFETADDGSKTVGFVSDRDQKKYTVRIDPAGNKLISGIKNNSRIEIRGTLCEKTDGSSFLKLTECKLAADKAE